LLRRFFDLLYILKQIPLMSFFNPEEFDRLQLADPIMATTRSMASEGRVRMDSSKPGGIIKYIVKTDGDDRVEAAASTGLEGKGMSITGIRLTADGVVQVGIKYIATMTIHEGKDWTDIRCSCGHSYRTAPYLCMVRIHFLLL
jgi:hypothetical protein